MSEPVIRLSAHPVRPEDASAAATTTEFDITVTPEAIEDLPADVDQVTVALHCESTNYQGVQPTHAELSPIVLLRSPGFTTRYNPPQDLAPGYHWITGTPTAQSGGEQLTGSSATFSLVVNPQPIVVSPGGLSTSIHVTGSETYTRVLSLDGDDWCVAIDPDNVGRQAGWADGPSGDPKPTKVPWVIQNIFPGYHGVAWYWHELTVPSNPHPNGRCLLRFHAVDYLADVYVNGSHIGGHEGSETPFALDATDAVRPDETNLIAVRVLNPTYEGIDGVALEQVAKANKHYPVQPNANHNAGGIVEPVELLLAPQVRVEDVYAHPDWKTGDVRVHVNLRNGGGEAVEGIVRCTVAPSQRAESVGQVSTIQRLPPGDTLIETTLHVEQHRLWELNDPFMYRVTASVRESGTDSADERSVRCGFRDFRYEDGYFRLNGKRIFLQGPLHRLQYPISYMIPPDPELIWRDVLMMKTLGFNFVRVAFSSAPARMLEVFDDAGIMLCQGHLGDWQMKESDRLEHRYDHSLAEMVRRDRNHPSIVMWGFLNETVDGRLFRHAADTLRLVRCLDSTRMANINSGRFDHDRTIGDLSNPESLTWDITVRDVHTYPPVPHTAETLARIRGTHPDAPSGPFIQTEFGQCSAVHVPHVLRHLEQRGQAHGDDAQYYREKLDQFMADWEAWELDECWARPEDFFDQSLATMAKLRLYSGNALRGNPDLIGHVMWNALADPYHGSGIMTGFRELKPGIADAVSDLNSPLRWSLFVNPVNVYRGASVRVEAVLSNADALGPGSYPVRMQVVGPNMTRILDREVQVTVQDASRRPEPPYAHAVFSEDVPVDGPTGWYRFIATFQSGGAAKGYEAAFHVTDPIEMPDVTSPVCVWGDDPELLDWLSQQGIQARSLGTGTQTAPEVIIASGTPPIRDGAPAFAELAERIARGSTVIFLDPNTLSEGDDTVRWVPLVEKGSGEKSIDLAGSFYRKDDWVKSHPFFDGLPSGRIMDYLYYRDIIPVKLYVGLEMPHKAICGGIRAASGAGANSYGSGLHLAAYRLGAGRFVVNNLKIRENLGSDPVAERIVRNIINGTANCTPERLEHLPADFGSHLAAIGYQ